MAFLPDCVSVRAFPRVQVQADPLRVHPVTQASLCRANCAPNLVCDERVDYKSVFWQQPRRHFSLVASLWPTQKSAVQIVKKRTEMLPGPT